MFGKKKQSGNIDSAIAHAVSYEVSIGDLARKSERRAWIVAFASLLMSLALAGGYYYVLPLKEKVPYVVMADPFSGTASVAALRDDPFYRDMVAGETLARANVANYVTARESFDREMLKLRDWTQVNVMSGSSQRAAFAELHSDTNPASPSKLVASNQVVRVRITNVVPIRDRGGIVGATVRFQRNLFDRASGKTSFVDNRIATMSFRYSANLDLSESLRWLNPLGFQVTDYRSDLDLTANSGVGIDQALADAAAAVGLAEQRDASIDVLREQARQLSPDSTRAPLDGIPVPPSGLPSEVSPAGSSGIDTPPNTPLPVPVSGENVSDGVSPP